MPSILGSGGMSSHAAVATSTIVPSAAAISSSHLPLNGLRNLHEHGRLPGAGPRAVVHKPPKGRLSVPSDREATTARRSAYRGTAT